MKSAKFTKSLTVALDPQAYAQIKAITDERQTSMADWVRRAVDDALAKNAQPEELKNDE